MLDVDYDILEPLVRVDSVPSIWSCKDTKDRNVVIKYHAGSLVVKRSLYVNSEPVNTLQHGATIFEERLCDDIHSSYMATVDLLLYLSEFEVIGLPFLKKLYLLIFKNSLRNRESQLLYEYHVNEAGQAMQQIVNIIKSQTEEKITNEDIERNDREN